MKMPLVLEDDDGIRPAGRPDECFYCRQKVGTPHGEECVIPQKKVKITYTFDLEIEVPYSWGKKQIEFHRNESSWCSDNAIRDLVASSINKDRCLCDGFEAEYIEDIDSEPKRYSRSEANERDKKITEELRERCGLTNG